MKFTLAVTTAALMLGSVTQHGARSGYARGPAGLSRATKWSAAWRARMGCDREC